MRYENIPRTNLPFADAGMVVVKGQVFYALGPMALPRLQTPQQLARLKRFAAPQSVDIHCHLLPDVDDGPATLERSLELCRALVNDGITTAIATPHQLGRYEGQNLPRDLRFRLAALKNAVAENEIPLAILLGADVRIDHRLTSLLDTDQICSLADNKKYLLLELPHETYIDPRSIVASFKSRERTIIVSHPERHGHVSRNLQLVVPWLAAGGALQVTAGSLLGDFGQAAESAAWRLLESGRVQVIASDAHNTRDRAPRMTEAIDAIADELGESIARIICLENPLRIVMGEPLLPAPMPLAKP